MLVHFHLQVIHVVCHAGGINIGKKTKNILGKSAPSMIHVHVVEYPSDRLLISLLSLVWNSYKNLLNILTCSLCNASILLFY